MKAELLAELVACSAQLQQAHTVARDHGREDVAQYIRLVGWDVAAALSSVREQEAEVAS